jgi:DNA replication protein DnaC
MTRKKTSQKTSGNDQIRSRILEHLQTLRVPLTDKRLDQLLAEGQREKLSGLQLLERVLADPAGSRLERAVARRIREARFPGLGSLETFDWSFNAETIDREPFEELAAGDFVRRKQNVVFVGKSGLGKSRLIEGIGRCCCARHRVRYITSAELIEELTAAAGDKTLPRQVRRFARYELLIIDELGFDKLERREYPDASSLLYKVVDARNQKASTALVTNIKFEDWTDYFDDPPLAMALLDRVVYRAIIHNLKGKSYRAHHAEPQGAPNKPNKPADASDDRR